jgi:hypothetical protein
MLKMRSKVVIIGSGTLGLAVLIASILMASQVTEAQTTVPQATEYTTEQLQAAYETKTKIALEKALADPEISKFTNGAFGVNQHFYPSEITQADMDNLIIHVYGKRNVVGDWKSSYSVTWSNNTDIEVKMIGDQIKSITPSRVPDVSATIVYDDEQQQIIAIVMQDPSVQQLIAGKNTYVRTIYDSIAMGHECPPGSCAIVFIDKVDRKEIVEVKVNPTTERIIDIRTVGEW